MYYRMNSMAIAPPSQAYFDTIMQGYRDFQLPMRYLREAVEASSAQDEIIVWKRDEVWQPA